jgi:Tol biopolymer transport system component
MNERMQMIVRLAILGVVTIAIGAGMYFLFFRARPSVTPPPTTTPPVTTPGGGLPTAGPGSPIVPGGVTPPTGPGGLPVSPVAQGGVTTTTTLTTSAVTSPTVTANGTVAYYDAGDGKFYTIDENGNAKALSDAKFPQASSVTFATGGKTAAIEFPDGSNVVYNFDTGAQSTLPSHWESFSFSEDGQTVATKSVSTDPSARALVLSSADGSSATPIAALGTNQDKVSVAMSPDGSIVGFSATGATATSTFGQNSIYLIGKDGKDAGVLFVTGSNFTPQWAPDSSHLIYSVADASQGYRATLWYADKDGDQKTATRRQIPINTLASKCTFASNTLLYCAVPTTMPAGGGSSPSLITSPDNLYKVDLTTLKATLIATPAVSTKMSNLSVSPAGDALFFADTAGRLNTIRLT